MSKLSGQDQQNSKQGYCQLPPQSFRINLKDTYSNISIDSYHYGQEQVNHFPPKKFLVFFLNRKGGGLWSWKNDKK